MGIYKFGNNTYPRRIRRRLNLGHIFQGKKCILWAGKYGIYFLCSLHKVNNIHFIIKQWRWGGKQLPEGTFNHFHTHTHLAHFWITLKAIVTHV